jgi:hypothetical protein
MLSPRRTQITVVDRTLRPSPKSSGCPLARSIATSLSLEITAQYIAANHGWLPRCSRRARTLRYPDSDSIAANAQQPASTSLDTSVSKTFDQFEQHLRDRDPRLIAALVVAAVLLCILIWLFIRWRTPSPEEVERRRRERVALEGRICDGVIVDARTLNGEDSVSPTPEVLVYSYRLAGVTYNCAQDVSRLADRIVGFRLDQPIQIRYDPRNPGNSILVSESWSGLWQK